MTKTWNQLLFCGFIAIIHVKIYYSDPLNIITLYNYKWSWSLCNMVKQTRYWVILSILALNTNHSYQLCFVNSKTLSFESVEYLRSVEIYKRYFNNNYDTKKCEITQLNMIFSYRLQLFAKALPYTFLRLVYHSELRTNNFHRIPHLLSSLVSPLKTDIQVKEF